MRWRHPSILNPTTTGRGRGNSTPASAIKRIVRNQGFPWRLSGLNRRPPAAVRSRRSAGIASRRCGIFCRDPRRRTQPLLPPLTIQRGFPRVPEHGPHRPGGYRREQYLYGPVSTGTNRYRHAVVSEFIPMTPA